MNKVTRQRLLTLISRCLQVKRVELLATKKQNVLEVVYKMFNYWTSDGGKENLSLPRFTFKQNSIFYVMKKKRKNRRISKNIAERNNFLIR